MDPVQEATRHANASKTPAKGPAPVKTTTQPESEGSGAPMGLVVALTVTTAALAVVAILTIVPRLRPTEPVRLMDQAVATWDSGAPADFSALYARDAVVIHADGTEVSGLAAIVADAKAAGKEFTMTRTGDVSATNSGTYASAVYRYSGAGRGTGLLVIQIEGGKITQQWSYDLP